jgi:hypothetical protein
MTRGSGVVCIAKDLATLTYLGLRRYIVWIMVEVLVSFEELRSGNTVTYLGLRRHIVWIMVEVLVSSQQLFLPKGLAALVTLERFLIGVQQHVGL